MKKSKMVRRLVSVLLIFALCLCGCGKTEPTATVTPVPTQGEKPTNEPTSEPTKVPDKEILMGALDGSATDKSVTEGNANYIELAVNVYYNDADTSYYTNESGKSIYVTKEGQYALTFDAAEDLSADAKTAGVNSLKNLTAIYLTDMGVINNTGKSTLEAANIIYDKVIVNGTELTVTMDKAKSAFKTNGVFDTNDPINSWDGSVVAEVAEGEHVANFTTVSNPTKITIIFTLSDLKWKGSEATPTPTPEAVVKGDNKAVFSNLDFTSMDALTLSKYLGNGINLGNTFEATSSAKNAIVSVYESAWGQPKTTKAMIQGYKNAGFDTLRIPVAWTNTMDFANGDFTINDDYIARVAEIVNYALEAEMFVVVNDHWDSGWWAMYGSNVPETVALAEKVYKEMWTQVATYFKDYSDMLIFESANEELGDTLNNNGSCATSGYLTDDGKYEMANKINQEFINIVRNTGGNNDDRFLLIAGYNTDIEKTCDARFKMPVDTAKNKLFLSVHYYTPWNYCGAGESGKESKWGIKKDYQLMDELLEMLTKFTKQGYGVIIGEYGALPVSATQTQNNAPEFTNYFLDNCDIYNYVPLLWDTNNTYHKSTCEVWDPAMANIFIERRYEKEAEAGDSYLETVKTNKKARLEGASEMWEGVESYEPGTPVAWIMWNGGAGTYSVGDEFNPADNTEGIKATNAVIEGAGAYSVSLDFAGGNDGLTFAALAIAHGEALFPNSLIIIESIMADGKKLDLKGLPYTCSDDGKTTRVNIYNQWVSKVPADIRLLGSPAAATPTPVDPLDMVGIKNITINFRLVLR